ncbi:MAG TPA: hypothetical protein VNS55_15165 [Nocardioides sp.]|nr:hypothetical protein [Nocardioides sp.]
MWDIEPTKQEHLSHDLPCPYCGHAGHRYLPCDRECGCRVDGSGAKADRPRAAG